MNIECPNCGGAIIPSKKRGRPWTLVRGIASCIPDDISIPTCTKCGDEYVSASLSRDIDKAVRKELAATLKELAEQIRGRDRVTNGDLERACKVAPSYLSHVFGGKRTPSAMLVQLLTTFSKFPEALHEALGRGGATTKPAAVARDAITHGAVSYQGSSAWGHVPALLPASYFASGVSMPVANETGAIRSFQMVGGS
jgi:hypothetical protein